MITKIDEIYARAAALEGKDPALMKAIGESMFQTVKDNMVGLKHSHMLVPHLGNFIVKSIKVEAQLKRYLAMRKYMCTKYPWYVDTPISKKAKELFNLYLNDIMTFKKDKEAHRQKKLKFVKDTWDSYEVKPTKEETANKYTSKHDPTKNNSDQFEFPWDKSNGGQPN